MKRVFALGELLVDFMSAERDTSLADCSLFIKKAGGAPPNALAALCKLGGIGLLASKVGNDPFGKFLINECKKNGIDTSMVIQDDLRFTTCAFVSLSSTGERDFVFARGADGFLQYAELDIPALNDCDIFHFGAATGLLDSITYDTYMKVLDVALENKKIIVFDPNYRQDFWKQNTDIFVQRSRKMASHSHIVKVSEQEALLISGEDNILDAAKGLINLGAKIVLITLSDKGALLAMNGYEKIIPSIKVNCVDATGAGDAFIGAFLYKLASLANIYEIFEDHERLESFVSFANRAGAICCTKLGAMEGMPTILDMGIDRVSCP